TYPFQHRRFWLTPSTASSADVSAAGEDLLWKAVDEQAIDTVAQMLALGDGDAAALPAVVGALRRWRADRQARVVVDSLRYRVGWQSVVLNELGPTRQRWLVVAFPEQADSDSWVTGLSEHYGSDIEILVVNPSDVGSNSLTGLLSTAVAGAHCDGIVSFLALDERPHPDFPGISRGLISTLLVGQAYANSSLSVPLWLVTQGAVEVAGGGEPASCAQAAVWGLGQSLCLEHPDRWGGLIDLPELPTPQHLRQLYTLLSCPQSEDQLAIGAHKISARRLYPAPLPAHVEPGWTSSGTALITGATGRLGKHIAHWLARAGASHLILVSRTAAHSSSGTQLQKELHAAGVSTTLASVDVTDRHALAAFLTQARRQHGPIRTVVHAAATITDHLISEVTTAQFCADYSKAIGADNLAELLSEDPPDTFILFSSAAATWGGAHQGCYAAANAHLDALACQLRAHTGTQALSIAWGLWADQQPTHASLAPHILEHFHRIGINAIPPQTALNALQHSLNTNDTHITVADVNWNQFLDIFTARRAHPLLTEITALTTVRPQAHSPASTVMAQLAGQSAAQQRQTVISMVTAITATVLAHPDPAALDPDRPFKDLGIDSLTALELRNSLTQHTGLTLPATVVFDHPSPNALAQHLIELII
ncbi:beta-ketoacyl reductase, partial [Mycobacterium persicum]